MLVDNYWYIVAILNLLGIAQGIFTAVALCILKGGNRQANYLLAALLVSFAIGIAGATLGASSYYRQFPHLIRIGDPVVLLIGPLFLFYARSLTGNKLTKKDLLHLLPFIGYVLFLIPFFLQTAAQKIAFVQQMQESTAPGILFIILIRSVFLLIYTYLTYRLLNHYNKQIKEQFSTIDKLNLDWLNQVAKLLFVVIACSFLMYALILTGHLSFLVSNYLTSLLLTSVIYTVGILGIRQARVFVMPALMEREAIIHSVSVVLEEARPVARYGNSTLSEEKSQKYLQKLLKGMQQDKLYLNSDLSLQLLADELEIPAHYLSQVINEQLGQNFFDFINSHRVEEVKTRLLDPAYSHFTILAIAFDSGFNSKSAFNLAFKNQTGQTPSQFRAQLKK
jgi:AraC-like DNA-binding protein